MHVLATRRTAACTQHNLFYISYSELIPRFVWMDIDPFLIFHPNWSRHRLLPASLNDVDIYRTFFSKEEEALITVVQIERRH